MFNVSIFEKKWLDLVFEGKNKEYGAYQLRRENSKTTFFAFLTGISIIGSGVFILSSFATTKPIVTDDGPILKPAVSIDEIVHHVQNLSKEKKLVTPSSNKSETMPKKPSLANLVVSSSSQAQQNILTNEDLLKQQQNTSSTGVTGGTGQNVGQLGGGTDTGGTNTGSSGNGGEIFDTSAVEIEPSFPGGVDKFRQFIGSNFRFESDDDESINLLIQFIVEKNGQITDVEVVKSNNEEANKEAVRVLKSLKTKWNPGKMGDKAVRVQYKIPIRINP